MDGISKKSEFLTTREAAELLRTTTATLATWRCTGKVELPYAKLGSTVLYKRSDIEEFVDSNYVR